MEDIIALILHVYSFTAPLPSRIHMWAVRALLHHLACGASKKMVQGLSAGLEDTVGF